MPQNANVRVSLFRQYFYWAIVSLWCACASAQPIPRQLENQADSLAKLLYLGAERSEHRRYYLFPTHRPEKTYAVVLFMFEPGNRYENWMAVFETAEQLTSEITPDNFTLAAFQKIGGKSWRAASFDRPSFSFDGWKGTITIKTMENSNDAPNYPSKPSKSLYRLEPSRHGYVLRELKTKP